MGLTLGGIAFQNFEIPEEMPFSGGKHLQVHKLIGGDRVFDDMGDDPEPIEWSGIFLGPSASSRARQLDAMKRAGGQFMLSWGSFSRQVYIRRFSPRYHFEFHVKYTICVEVVPTRSSPAPSISDMIAGDFGSLGAIAAVAAGGPLGALVGAAQTAIGVASAAAGSGQFADAPVAALLGASSTVANLANGARAMRDAADAGLPQVDLSVIGGLSPIDAGAALLSMVGGTDAVSAAATAAGYLGRIAGNVALYGG